MWLIAGLGNPGDQYQANRHNVGFMVADELARRWRLGDAWRSKFGGELLRGEAHDAQVLLLKPMKYMNLSGEVVAAALGFFKLDAEQLVVVHDELDLDFGRLQVKRGGGTAGHNGLESIVARLGTSEFGRIRIGIGRPPDAARGADYVLSDFSKVERKELPFQIADAADAVETIVKDGMVAAMN